ncbi:MAG: DNA repair protein RadC, partial [Peptococcaceae bacterium]|nr:DNA repair protein RadC [Peptococcaceae bacterium]
AEAGQIIGIHVIDHIIVGEDSYYSFSENGLL